jgi:hypothetical protein
VARELDSSRDRGQLADSENAEDGYRRRLEGARGLLRTFDQIRTRPTWRHGDVPLPILSITGPYEATAAVTQAIDERCDGTPYVRISTSTNSGTDSAGSLPPYMALAAKLRRASREFSAVAPRGDPALRFPLFAQVLWLLELQVTEADPDKLHEDVRRAARRRSLGVDRGSDRRSYWANVRAYAEGPLPAWAATTAVLSAGWAERLTTWLGVVAIIAGLVVGSLHVLLLSYSWAGWRRYRWFLRQPYLIPENRRYRPRSFIEFAVRVVQVKQRMPHGSPAEAALVNDSLEALLVNAFLEDIRLGYLRTWWKPWRRVAWARTSYPVLLVEGDIDLVHRLEEVRERTCSSDPVVVVFIGRSGDSIDSDHSSMPDLATTTPPSESTQLWTGWRQSWTLDRTLSSHRVLKIGVKQEDATFLTGSTVPVRIRRRPMLAHPALPWIVAAAVVLTSAFKVIDITTANCAPGIWRARDGECIGISDGGFAFHPRLAKVLSAIHKANQNVVSSGQPYATVVYFGALSRKRQPTAGGDDLAADVHGELAGIAITQRQLIKNSNDSSKLQLRVLIANTGSGYVYAEDVAHVILDRVVNDKTIMGVVGFGESRQQVHDAILLMSRRAIPMISTTATYDALGMRSDNTNTPSFFPLAPPNSLLAENAVRWARAGFPERGIAPLRRRAAVFLDTTVSDLYGKDMGQRFLKSLGNEGEPAEFSGAASVETKVTQICDQASPPNFIFYAGRGAQFGAFINALTKSRCRDITVIAGDGPTQYVNDHAVELGRNNRVRMMYEPLASPSAWADVPPQHRTDFYDNLNDLLQSLDMSKLPANQQPSREFAAQANDAMDALVRAAQSSFIDQRYGGLLDRGGVLLALQNLPPVDDDSGLVKLHGGKDGHHPLDRPVLLVTVDRNGHQVLVRQCGRLYQEQRPTLCHSK